MSGPNVQFPSPSNPIATEDGTLTTDYATLLHTLQSIAFYSTRSGPTANRPTSSGTRWIGMPYFDTSLSTHGLEIHLAIASTSVWVNGAGAVV